MDQKQTRRSLIERISKKAAMIGAGTALAGVAAITLAEEAEAGCAWYYTGYTECRPKWQCIPSGVARYHQQAYYCSDRNPGPLAYRFIQGACGC